MAQKVQYWNRGLELEQKGDGGVQVRMTSEYKGWQEKELQRKTGTRTGIKQVKEQEAPMCDGSMEGIFA